MANCCLCGKKAEGNYGTLLVNGRPTPICESCCHILDDIDALQQDDPKREELFKTIQEKMVIAGAAPAVIKTIQSLRYLNDLGDMQSEAAMDTPEERFSSDVITDIKKQGYAEQENDMAESEDVQKQEYVEQENDVDESEEANSIESSETSTSEASIISHSNFLAAFTVIFLVLTVVLCIIIGVSLPSYESATAWALIIGCILTCVLTYSVIMLYLSVAKTIANISNKLDETNEQIASTNETLNRLADMITSEPEKQKK